MDIFFINNLRFPTEKAHGYQIVKMCEALADLGHTVTLVHPTRVNHLTETVFSYYHLRPNFTVKLIKTPDFFTWGLPSRLAYYLNSLAFYWRVRTLKLPPTAIIISRNPELLWFYGGRGYRSFYDAHKWPNRVSVLLKWFLSKTTGVIANSVGTAAEAKKYQLNNILTVPNGVDLADFVNRESEVMAIKKKFNLTGKIVIAYAGHFYKWKGVDTLIKALALLPFENFICLLVGDGPKSDQKNILTIGQIPHREVAAHLLAADILVLPTAPISLEAERFTSPIKLFEYLAAGKAIVASDLPSSRVIISDQEARFFTAGDEHSLASVLQSLATDPEVRQSLGEQGRRLALNYTWAARASKVSTFLAA